MVDREEAQPLVEGNSVFLPIFLAAMAPVAVHVAVERRLDLLRE